MSDEGGGGVLRRLLALFKIDVDDKAIKESDKTVKEFSENIKEAGKKIAEAFALYEIKEFVQNTIETGAHVADLSAKLGLATHDLQAFQYAAGLAGVDSESAGQSIGFFNRMVGEAVTGNKAASQSFNDLGIKLQDGSGKTKDLNELLLETSDALHGLPDKQRQAAYAQQLFSRAGQQMIPVLAGGREELSKTLAEFDALGGGMSDEFVKQAKETEDEEKKVKLEFQAITTTIIGGLLPGIREAIKWFREMVDRVRHVTERAHAFQDAFRFLAALGIAATIYKIVTALRALTMSELLAYLPLLLWIAGVALLYLAYNDFMTLLRGGDSVLGRFLDYLFGVGTATQFAKDMNDTLGVMTDLFKNLGSVIWNSVMLPIEAILDALGGLSDALLDLSLGNFKGAWQDFKNAGVQALDDIKKRAAGVSNAAAGVADDFTLNAEGLRRKREGEAADAGHPPGTGIGTREVVTPVHRRAAVAHVPGALAHTSASKPAAAGGATIQQQNTFHTEVHTSSDRPHDVGKAVGQGISTPIQRANSQAIAAVRRP